MTTLHGPSLFNGQPWHGVYTFGEPFKGSKNIAQNKSKAQTIPQSQPIADANRKRKLDDVRVDVIGNNVLNNSSFKAAKENSQVVRNPFAAQGVRNPFAEMDKASSDMDKKPQRKIVRREAPANLSWAKNTPDIRMGRFHINGGDYEISPLGEGKNHVVYKFEERTSIAVGNLSLDTESIVLKKVSPSVGPNLKKNSDLHNNTKAGYEYLIQKRIPVARVYVDPQTFKDTDNERNGGFWIVEYCPSAVTGEGWKNGERLEELSQKDRTLLTWVKGILTESKLTGREIINDFRMPNVRYDNEGNFKIIDFSMPEIEGWDIKYHLENHIKEWTCGNPNIEAYLRSDMSNEVSDPMIG